MSSGDMSYRRAPTFYDHLDHNIIFFKTEQRRSLAGDVWVWRNRINTVCFPLVCHGRFRLVAFGVVHVPQIDRRNSFSILDQRLMRKFLLRCCCVTQLFASLQVQLLGQMCGFQKCTRFRLTLIWNLSEVTCKIGILEETQFAF